VSEISISVRSCSSIASHCTNESGCRGDTPERPWRHLGSEVNTATL
jgi:hypothetical protein